MEEDARNHKSGLYKGDQEWAVRSSGVSIGERVCPPHYNFFKKETVNADVLNLSSLCYHKT